MRFNQTNIPGAYLIQPELKQDERGFFTRVFCADEFALKGLDAHLVQCSVSYNHQRGTLRGLHFQAEPFEEVRLVRCTAGSIFDVVLDLRLDSPTRWQWYGTELSAQNHHLMYIPKGCAHGFITLEDASEVFYQMSEFYHPESARGVRWDDPAFGIDWPLAPVCISARDANYPPIQMGGD